MSLPRVLIPILIIILVFSMISNVKGDQELGTLKGIITSKDSNQPVENAIVKLVKTDLKAKTAGDGTFAIGNIPSGVYDIIVTAPGYFDLHVISANIAPNFATRLEYPLTAVSSSEISPNRVEAIFGDDLPMKMLNSGAISGKITDRKTGDPLVGAVIRLDGTSIGAQTDSTGKYEILNVPVKSYTAKIYMVGHKVETISDIRVNEDKTSILDIAMEEASIEERPAAADGLEESVELSKNEDMASRRRLSYMAFDKEYGSSVAGIVEQKKTLSQGQWLPHGGTTPPNGRPYSGTFFKHYGVNPFVDTEDDHLSTFAIDVDDASYSVARGYLGRGHLPEPPSVRVEEFINFFNYDYPPPHSQRFKVYVEGAPSKFGQNCDIIRIGIKGQEVNPEKRKPAVLTFVIDVSGSMNIDSRLGLVKKALRILVNNLNEDDLVGIAVYASHGRKILDHTSIRERDKILHAIERLSPGGSTYAEEGLKIGYKMASANFKKGAINRIILCSDGVANVGRTGADDILREIKRYVEQGITLTAVGFGMDNYNDILMEKLGDKGNGHFAYVDNLEQAKRIFMQNLTGTLQVIARDVKIQVDFDPEKVRSYRLLGYENRDVDDSLFRDDKEDGGEIGSGHDVTALYEVKFKEGARGKFATVYLRYKDPDFVDEVTENSIPLMRSDIAKNFDQTSPSFRLAVCAAEFAEILRDSYYAKGGNLADVLDLAQQISAEMRGNDDVIEFTAMVSRAKKLWEEEELLSSFR